MKNVFFVVFVFTCLNRVDSLQVFASTIHFNGSTQFADLSVDNFKNQLDSQYTYKLIARPMSKVSIYFLTTPVNNSVIELFDGADATAAPVDVSYITVNIVGEVIPAVYESTGENFFLRVTPAQVAGADFQAIATDVVQSRECNPLIHAVGNQFRRVTATFQKPGASCTKILRAVDTTNSPGLNLRVQNYNETFNGIIYKGLSMTDANKLVSINDFYAFDRNLVFKVNDAAQFIFSLAQQGASTLISTAQNPGSTQTLMSSDYLPYRELSGVTEQTFDIIGQGAVNRMRVEFLNDIGSANVQVKAIKLDYSSTVSNYTKATLPNTPLVLDAQELYIHYSGAAATAKGLYATVSDASDGTILPNTSTNGTGNGGNTGNNGNGNGSKDKSASSVMSLVSLTIFCLLLS